MAHGRWLQRIDCRNSPMAWIMNVTYLHFAPPSVRNTWPVGPSPVAKKVRPCGTARSICARTQHRLCLCFLTAFNANCRMPEGEAAKHSPILLPPSQTWTWNPSQNMFAACSCTIRTTRARHSLEGPVDAPTSAHNLIIIIFRIRVACLQHVQKAACPYSICYLAICTRWGQAGA